MLWKLIKQCHENQNWSCFSEHLIYLPRNASWLLPLAVFCPMYNQMLLVVDAKEFQQLEKPLSLKDIECLILILRKTLWQVLNLDPPLSNRMAESAPVKLIQRRVSIAGAELMSQSQISAAKIQDSASHVRIRPRRIRLRIRRGHILEDAFRQLSTLSENSLRAPIQVTYVNKFGIEEAGIDGGGLFKDFMENVTQEAFNSKSGLFKETTEHLLYPNPGSAMVHKQHLQYFHFLGTLLAKAMFEGILVDIPFASFFLRKLKHKNNTLDDLPSLDPELYHQLIKLQHHEGISRLALYFVIQKEQTVEAVEELLPGGKNLPVTNENVITYIHRVADYRLNDQIHQQTSRFLKGFQQLIKKDWIDIFNEDELQLMISGSPDGFDLDDLRSYTNYSGGYHSDHDVIDMFWEVLKSFSTENKRKFLKFVTGCSRGPLLGFGYLTPPFCIHGTTGGEASQEALDRLSTSATCANILKLPPYKSKELMEQKLLYSINANAGFFLS